MFFENITKYINIYICIIIYMSKLYVNKFLNAPIKVLYDKFYDYIYNSSKNNNIERIYEEVSTYNKITSWFQNPTKIIDNLYLGSAYNAASYYNLKENNIKLIINVTNSISEYYPDEFEYLKYELYDNNNDSISNYLVNSYIQIKSFQKNNPNGNILVHCFAGASRSASVILYYLILENRKKDPSYNIDNALDFLKEKRIVVNPTYKFVEEIKLITNIK